MDTRKLLGVETGVYPVSIFVKNFISKVISFKNPLLLDHKIVSLTPNLIYCSKKKDPIICKERVTYYIV